MAKKRGKYKSTLRGYAAYSRLYDAKEAQMKAKGYKMSDEKLTKEEYEVTYQAEYNDRKDLVIIGKRKTVGDINRTLVQEATYEYSKDQARGYQEYLKREKGIDAKINDIRGKKINIDFGEINQKRGELIAQGFTSDKIPLIIAQEFFGSE